MCPARIKNGQLLFPQYYILLVKQQKLLAEQDVDMDHHERVPIAK